MSEAGEMGCGGNEGAAGAADGHAQGVVDGAALELVEADDGGEDGQAGGVGGGPAVRAEPVGFQIEDGGLGALPAGIGLAHLVELVKHPMDWIDDERVAVAVQVAPVALDIVEGEGAEFGLAMKAGGPVLDGEVVGHGVGSGVRLGRIAEELDLDPRLAGGHEDEAHIGVGAERLGGADAGDNLPGIRV